MSAGKRAPFVALLTLLQHRFPDLDDPARLIDEGVVSVNGVPSINPRTRVRADAVLRIHRPGPLRGTIKLTHALTTFAVRTAGVVALDLGAAAGGFTQVTDGKSWASNHHPSGEQRERSKCSCTPHLGSRSVSETGQDQECD